MEYVTVWDPIKNTRQLVPLDELAPGFIKISLGGEEVLWVGAKKMARAGMVRPSPAFDKPVNTPFSAQQREVLKQLRRDLIQVFPQTLPQWEAGFRADAHPHWEMQHWRWIAFKLKELLGNRECTQAYKRDLFHLLLGWINCCKEDDATLATVSLEEMSREEAANLVKDFFVTPVEFYGGAAAKGFPGAHVNDFTGRGVQDGFSVSAKDGYIIFGVNSLNGDVVCLFGSEKLERREGNCGFFSVNFEIPEQLSALCAAVASAKGWYESNGKRIGPDGEELPD